MQRKIEKKGNLLNEKGEIRYKGYATKATLRYKRNQVKAAKWRIKEWDHYLMMNEDFAVGLRLEDSGYIGQISVLFIDFTKGFSHVSNKVKLFPLGNLRLPETSLAGDVIYRDKTLELHLLNNGVQRKLKCKMKSFNHDKEFECQFVLKDEPRDSIVLMLGSDKQPNTFCYTQKIIGMQAVGYAKYDNRLYKFNRKHATAMLDWGRGILPLKKSTHWAVANGSLEGKSLSFIIADLPDAFHSINENTVFYEGNAHKLDQILFEIPKLVDSPHLKNNWSFTSTDQQFQMTFIPQLKCYDYLDRHTPNGSCYKVFGKFSGKINLDDSQQLYIENLFGCIHYSAN